MGKVAINRQMAIAQAHINMKDGTENMAGDIISRIRWYLKLCVQTGVVRVSR